ncbi:hypothetical protein HMI54_009425 [Coelomomyces lativittatus]|nr:hypothetical protein HMI54_009425 [Coelomomyces lativittatus]
MEYSNVVNWERISEDVGRAQGRVQVFNQSVERGQDGKPTDGETVYRIGYIELLGLQPRTTYYFVPIVDGTVELGERSTFTFGISSCAKTASEDPVFDSLLRHVHNISFFVHLGDFHYERIVRNELDLFRSAYDKVFVSDRQRRLWQQVNFVYTWDDNDFGPNDADRTAPGRLAARLVDHFASISRVHAALPAGRRRTDTSGVHRREVSVHSNRRTFRTEPTLYVRLRITIQFGLMDISCSHTADPDGPNKTMLGTNQKRWFREELLRAKQSQSPGMALKC